MKIQGKKCIFWKKETFPQGHVFNIIKTLSLHAKPALVLGGVMLYYPCKEWSTVPIYGILDLLGMEEARNIFPKMATTILNTHQKFVPQLYSALHINVTSSYETSLSTLTSYNLLVLLWFLHSTYHQQPLPLVYLPQVGKSMSTGCFTAIHLQIKNTVSI